MPCRYWRHWSDGRKFKKQEKGDCGSPFFSYLCSRRKVRALWNPSFQPVSLSCPARCGCSGLMSFPGWGSGRSGCSAVRFGLVAVGRRHGFVFLIPAAGVALPVCVLWGLVGRSPYGLSLARWYAGLRVVLHFAALLMLLFSGYDPHLYGGTEMFIRALPGMSYMVPCGSSSCSIWSAPVRWMPRCPGSAATCLCGALP